MEIVFAWFLLFSVFSNAFYCMFIWLFGWCQSQIRSRCTIERFIYIYICENSAKQIICMYIYLLVFSVSASVQSVLTNNFFLVLFYTTNTFVFWGGYLFIMFMIYFLFVLKTRSLTTHTRMKQFCTENMRARHIQNKQN